MGHDSIELFSDYFAQTTNALTKTDARIKLVFSLAMLALVLASGRITILLMIAAFAISSLIVIRIPLRVLLVRMAAPLFMIGTIVVLQGFFFGVTPLYSLKIFGLDAPIYREGLEKGFLIGGRVLAGTSLMLFLSMTTPINRLLGALRFFKVPGGWLDIMAFSYRYIFVFIEETQNIMDAQRLRLGYSGLITGLKSWGTLVGSLFTRVYDQAEATHSAMLLRGYNGNLYIADPDPLQPRDIRTGLTFVAVFVALLVTMLFWG